MADKPLPPIERVGPERLRAFFNQHILPKLADLTETIIEDRHPALTAAREPYCTQSQMVSYRDPVSDEEIARIHRYLRPDGTLGASGKPDPKIILLKGILYRLVKGKTRS